MLLYENVQFNQHIHIDLLLSPKNQRQQYQAFAVLSFFQKFILILTHYMDIKYRIKRRLNSNDPEKSHSAIGLSPKKHKSSQKHTHNQSQQKRFKSQKIKPSYMPSPKKHHSDQSTTLYNMKTFSKQHIHTNSPQLRKQDITLRNLPESKSLYSSIQLKSSTLATPNSTTNPHTNIRQQMTKFPRYVSKSNLMIQTKKKLLEAKHNIRLGRDCPILQTIQDSVNQDRTAFSRKMKLQLCRKGNYDLIGFLHRDIDESLDKSIDKSPANSKDNYKARNIPYLLMNQYRDPYTLQKQQRVHKMEEMKRRLKVVRRNNNLSCLGRRGE